MGRESTRLKREGMENMDFLFAAAVEAKRAEVAEGEDGATAMGRWGAKARVVKRREE